MALHRKSEITVRQRHPYDSYVVISTLNTLDVGPGNYLTKNEIQELIDANKHDIVVKGDNTK